MSLIGGLPAHILLVHAIVVLMPLAALLLVVTAVHTPTRRRLAGANAVLAVAVAALVPVTTSAGEWLEKRVESTAAVRTHTQLGDTALYVALPLAVLALVIWWRQREHTAASAAADTGPDTHAAAPAPPEPAGTGTRTATATDRRPTAARVGRGRRGYLAPGSRRVTAVLVALCIVAAAAATYDVYLIGDSGARATWQDGFSTTEPASAR